MVFDIIAVQVRADSTRTAITRNTAYAMASIVALVTTISAQAIVSVISERRITTTLSNLLQAVGVIARTDTRDFDWLGYRISGGSKLGRDSTNLACITFIVDATRLLLRYGPAKFGRVTES